MRRLFLLTLLFISAYDCLTQTPFTREGQVFAIMAATNELALLEINPSNGAPQFTNLFPLGQEIKAIGFRNSDGLLYGLDPDDFVLYQIGADGSVVPFGTAPLEPGLEYESGDITPDGRFFVTTGAQNGQAKTIVYIDLESPDLAVRTTNLGGNFNLVDVAVNPYTDVVYGFDEVERQLYEIDLPNNRIFRFFPMDNDSRVNGLYFDAFGNLFGYGNRNAGIVGGLYRFSLDDGDESEESTGGPNDIHDLASCPFSIEFQNDVIPKIAFPCEEIEFVYSIANLSGSIQNGIDFEATLPNGFTFSSIETNPFGGNQQLGSTTLRIDGMSLPNGISDLIVKVEVGDIESGSFRSGAIIRGVPAGFGGDRTSDYVRTVRRNDLAVIEVNKVEEDSLFFTRFACIGDDIILDGSDFGTIHQWSTGERTPTISVSGNGTFFLEASSGCQSTYISYEVATASCPFTIELRHEIEPDSTLPCTEVLYTFVFENDSGIEYENLSFIDTLPEELSIVEIINNPLGGRIRSDVPSNVVYIDEAKLPAGLDTLEMIVEVGNISPGRYGSQARIQGFPTEVGPFRLSDNPATLFQDSTYLIVLGVESDSLFLERPLCTGTSIILDGTPFGIDYLWDDGSMEATRSVSSPGIYQLTVFDGCDPSFLFFEVVPGKVIDVQASAERPLVNLGQSVALSASVLNEGDSLIIAWADPLDTTLTCLDCLFPMARPLEDVTYKIVVQNEICSDSAFVNVQVDNSRRIYGPTAFSPNNDGVNDEFFLQSPDFARLKSFAVFNRWGAKVFEAVNTSLTSENARWDGHLEGQLLANDAYLWVAEIEFLDQKTEVFSGEVTLLR